MSEVQREKTLADEAAASELILAHDYDGIREYDNPLPFWWVGVFIASIFFAIGYWVYYHGGGPGMTQHAVLLEDQAALDKLREEVMARSTKATPETLAQLARAEATATKMKPMFVRLCAPCHNPNGSGKIGPNFTDDYQKHGKDRMALYVTIRDGVVDKGMEAWGKKLKPLDVVRMAAYVSTLRGQNIAGGKAPQGVKVPPYK